MINEAYQTVQQLMNKEQLGYFKPIAFNLFAGIAIRKEYNSLFIDHKTEVRKMNWMLDGRDFANLSEHKRQLLEYYSFETLFMDTTPSALEVTIPKPTDCEFIEDLFSQTKRIEKQHYSDYRDLLRNIYAKPTDCSPICTLVGDTIKISPNSIEKVKIHYLRRPKTPKWTFQEVNGKAYFDPTANDFQDFDIPPSSYDSIVSYIAEQAGVSIRDGIVIQSANQEQAQDIQSNNQQ